jgi:hypothetical protein
MARSQPRNIFGVHGCTPYSRTTGLPYGELRVISSSSLTLNATIAEIMGGSSKFPWAAEEGSITAELSLKVGELPNFMYTLFLGIAPTATGSEASGNLDTLTNVSGTSIQNGTNGIASVFLLAGSATNLKFGHYAVAALTASTFNVYLLSSLDAGRGTDTSFLTDDMIVASAIGFTASVASVPALGISFAQVGTPAFVFSGTADTATFNVRPVGSSNSVAIIGGIANQTFPEFGALVYAQKRGNGEMLEFDVYRCKGAGMPLPFDYGAFAAFDVKVKALYDSVKDGLFAMRHVSAPNAN